MVRALRTTSSALEDETGQHRSHVPTFPDQHHSGRADGKRRVRGSILVLATSLLR